jgi:hypothetical protein
MEDAADNRIVVEATRLLAIWNSPKFSELVWSRAYAF